MALTADVKKSVLGAITEWKDFLSFLDGFSLDGEIDDAALKVKQTTEKLEALLGGSVDDDGSGSATSGRPAPALPADDDFISEEVYDDTMVGDSNATADSGLYEIDDDDSKPPPTPTPKEDTVASKKESRQWSKKAKKSKQKSVGSSDNESLSSAGSAKDAASTAPVEAIPVRRWSIAEDPDCSISGRLTKRTNPGKWSLFKSERMFAAICGGIFYYFEKQASKKQKGAFHIADYTGSPYPVEQMRKSNKREFIFQLEAEGKPTYYFSTQTEDPMHKWIEMFNKLASLAKEQRQQQQQQQQLSQQQVPGASSAADDATEEFEEDVYECYDDAQTETSKDNAEDDELYTAPDDTNDDRIEESPPTPPSERKQAPSLPPARSAILREKPQLPPLRDNNPPSEVYDDGTSVQPKSWIHDAGDDDQEVYDEAESFNAAVHTRTPGKQQEMAPLSPAAATTTTTTTKSTKQSPIDVFFYGMWSCKPNTDHELQFEHGDLIEVLERRYDADGWWVGHLKGKVGLVPKNYLSPAYRKI